MEVIPCKLSPAVAELCVTELADVLSSDTAQMPGVLLLLPDGKLGPDALLRGARQHLAGLDPYLVLYLRHEGIGISAVRQRDDRACLCCRNYWLKDTLAYEAVDDRWRLNPDARHIVRRIVALKLDLFRSENMVAERGIEVDVMLHEGNVTGLENYSYPEAAGCLYCGSESSGSVDSDAAQYFLDRKFGLVGGFSMYADETTTAGEWPFMFVADGEAAGRRITACGKDAEREVAIAKTFSEYIERLALLTPVDPSTQASRRLGELFESREEYAAFGGTHEAEWARMHDLTVRCIEVPNRGALNGRVLPRQLFLPTDGEPRLFNVTSSGCAARYRLEDAVADAVWEVIERDAFLRAWHYADVEARVRSGKTSRFEQLLWERERLSLETYLLRSAAGHVFLAVARSEDPDDKLRFACGLGAGRAPEGALRAAVNELCQVVASLKARLGRREEMARAFALMSGGTPVEAVSDHALRYALTDPWTAYDFRVRTSISSDQWTDFFETRTQTRADRESALIDRDAFVLSVHNPVAESYGYKVVKVVIPPLLPFYIGEMNIPLSLRECRNPRPHPLA
jgi:ribosomal protein S12 methylthiotransferase accessory factor YcaO